MDALKHFRLSRGGHQSHVSRLLTITTNLPEKSDETPLTAKEIVCLTNYMEQLHRKKETLEDLDVKILTLINEESELKLDVIESAELQSTLDEHIAQIKFLLTTHKPAVTLPVSTTDLASVPVSPTTVSSTEPLGDTPSVASDMPLESSSHPVVSEESLVTNSAATSGTPPVVSNTSPAVSYTTSSHSTNL